MVVVVVGLREGEGGRGGVGRRGWCLEHGEGDWGTEGAVAGCEVSGVGW